MQNILLYILVSVVGLVLLFWLLKKGGTFIKSSVYGIGALLAVNLASFFTGISIGINLLTAGFTFAFGLPGVALMLLLKIL